MHHSNPENIIVKDESKTLSFQAHDEKQTSVEETNIHTTKREHSLDFVVGLAVQE